MIKRKVLVAWCRKFFGVGLILGLAATVNAGSIYDKNGFKANFSFEGAALYVNSHNTNYGGGQDYDTTTDDDTDIVWYEYYVKPSLSASWDIDRFGSLYGNFSAIFEGTEGDGDVYGGRTDPDTEDYTFVDKLYAGWKSGGLFETTDLLDISIGRQDIPIGRSFVVKKAQGVDRGTYWLIPSSHFEKTAVVRLNTSPVRADLMYFTTGDSDAETEVLGGNVEYTNATFGNDSDATLAFMYLNILDSDNLRRDGMNVYNARSGFAPLGFMGNKDLSLYFEYVWQKNSDDTNEVDAESYWAEIAYTFSKVKFSPKIQYSYMHRSGGDSANNSGTYDPLFWSSNGWGTGYSEIWGDNSYGTNENRHTVQVSATFSDTLTAGAAYQVFTRDTINGDGFYGATSDDDLGDEYIVYADYGVTDWLWIGGAVAVGSPGTAGEELIGGDETMKKVELYTYFYF